MTLELIQIVEDDSAQAGLLDYTLRKARFRTNVARDGETALADIRRLHPALVLLDVMLPGLDGYGLCRRLREIEETQRIPVIMLTALGGEEHRVAGLEFGADDYIAKPFSPREVLSRVRAVLRRAGARCGAREVHLGGELTLDESYVAIRYRGRRIDLTGAEWAVLRKLASRAGELVTREELIGVVWGDDVLMHEHELDRLVGRLRSKLERGDRETRFQAVPSVGYLLRATDLPTPVPQ
jgi:two-component system phosphate regulon response regulator PhoB